MSMQLAPAPRHAPRPAVRASAEAIPRPDPRPVPRPARRPAPQRPVRRPSEQERSEERRGHLRVVQPGERTLRRLTPFGGLLLTAFVFVVMAALAGAHTLIAQGQIRLDELDGQVRTEQARYQQLRKDVAGMESPERVVAAAQSLGMVTPDDLVYLQPDEASEDIAAPVDAADDVRASRVTDSSWSTRKPMLEAPTP